MSSRIGWIFGVPFAILIFACPILEIGKIELFSRTDGVLTYDTNVEYTYLVLSLVAPSVLILVYFFKCNWDNISPTTAKSLLVVYLFASIGISIAYTVFTINELKGIPFGCPDNYHYETSKVQTACQARAANFISLWAFIFFLILNSILLILGVNPLDEDKLFARDSKRRKSKSATSTQPPLGGGSGPFSQIELGQQQQQMKEKEDIQVEK
ncbi:hypothetical protein RclHR1_00720042 [Rhizophagus clarus]|uniref:MARVEL domain-containing protein n=1 Tax=Rhizophagus clarus TaxID=94130 RepID=A0A2Z6S1X7_9GLOM|nr:hypothetical protein RclHR1_00720042 [Rhizophagus clarus]GES94908.1 hypothetical protein GLOIN_2v1469747 [Rhizophagus clarus]